VEDTLQALGDDGTVREIGTEMWTRALDGVDLAFKITVNDDVAAADPGARDSADAQRG
jgi:hypothetical protein